MIERLLRKTCAWSSSNNLKKGRRETIDKYIYYQHFTMLKCFFFFSFGLNILTEHVSFTRIEDQRLIRLEWLCLDKF